MVYCYGKKDYIKKSFIIQDKSSIAVTLSEIFRLYEDRRINQ